MALTRDQIFKRSVAAAEAASAFVGITATSSPPLKKSIIGDEKKRLLSFDLNAPPKDDDEEFVDVSKVVVNAIDDDNETDKENIEDDNEEAFVIENMKRVKRWKTLLRVSEVALHEYEKEDRRLGKKETRTRGHGGEKKKARKVVECSNKNSNDGDEFEFVGSESPVVRSTRGRTLAMPSKFKDSFLGSVVVEEAELGRRNRSGKAGTASSYRKSR